MTTSPDRGAVLVLRVWIEEGRFRARITQTLDVSRAGETSIAKSSPAEAYAAVRAWLESFTGTPLAVEEPAGG
jgi:hypothetical protein